MSLHVTEGRKVPSLVNRPLRVGITVSWERREAARAQNDTKRLERWCGQLPASHGAGLLDTATNGRTIGQLTAYE